MLAAAVLMLAVTSAASPSAAATAQGRGRGRTPAPDQGAARQREPKISRAPQFRGEDTLVHFYDLILDARFAQFDAEIGRTCPSTVVGPTPLTALGPSLIPVEACRVLAATAVWWRIQLDPESHELDDVFSAAVDRAIHDADAWTVRAPDEAEAWFYLGAAYAVRVQWRVLRDEKLSAARDGKRIKDALERALALDRDMADAYFGIGMYRYYADVAPAAARFLRFLLLLPGGDRKDGLAQMLRARDQGRLLQGEADYQLHIIYLWYERQTPRALALLRALQKRYPGNPLFPLQIAEIQDVYQHDVTASLETYEALLAQAQADRVNDADLAEVRARFGIARHLDTLGDTDEAIEHLQRIVALRPAKPYSALALAELRLGEAYDRLNARSDAMAHYERAVRAAPPDDPRNVRRDAAERLRRPPNAAQAEAFRLSLDGWRQLELKDMAAARSSLERSLALNPRDPIARYRYGHLLSVRREPQAALAEFERALRDARACPPPIVGRVHLEMAQVLERLGARDRAIASYRHAATLFGADADTHATASRALARLEK
jgi:tetratricopeptide (TPR) repeat protein